MIVGHQQQWQFLTASAKINKLSHGLLFYGQEQLGKKFLAKEFVKFLNCCAPEHLSEPCQVCRNCQDIQKQAYPDFFFLEPQKENGGSGEIKIAQIRELIWNLSLRPYSSIFKAAILDQAHTMNQEAQSCFLKLLEEPKGNAILILISEYPELLLPTILSRVQKIRFSPVINSEIEKYLIGNGTSSEQAKYLASLSFGRPGLAQSFAADEQKIESQKKIISELIKISNSDLAHRFQYVKNLLEDDSENAQCRVKEVLGVWLRFLRKIMLNRFASPSKEKDHFGQYSLLEVENIIRAIQSTSYLLANTNINPKLAIENLLIKI